jgi:glycolate oxidase iron-sulfur subunit
MAHRKLSSGHFSNCTHCGLCLSSCPTFELTGDENNSPRGRLRLWREEDSGRLEDIPWTSFYTEECVGCLACESACPANVPYGDLLESVRFKHRIEGRSAPKPEIRLAATAVRHPRFFNLALLPARLLRRLGVSFHNLVFGGAPSLIESTSAYARRLVAKHRPTGPRVALLTGCLMEGLFREINFATVRVLVENNVQCIVPEGQGCCGALHEHTGLTGVEQMRKSNQTAFESGHFDLIITNSAGCGHSLSKSLRSRMRVQDVLTFLGEIGPVPRQRSEGEPCKVYVDLPCHLLHGQKQPGIPHNVLDATGYEWQLAPNASDCCGSGGVYNIQNPENAKAILARKAAFLNKVQEQRVILATANHVCMMQWHSAASTGVVTRPFAVRHVVQLLDPGERF